MISARAAAGSQPSSADGMVDVAVGGPGFRRFVRFDVAVTGDDRAHPRRDARRDIALGVADVDASRRRDAEDFRRGEQRRGMRLGKRRRVAADHRGGALVEAEPFDERRRVPRRLVGHDSPLERARLDGVEQRVHVREQFRVDAERRLVVRQERVAQRAVIGVLGQRRPCPTRSRPRAPCDDEERSVSSATGSSPRSRRTRLSAAPRSGAVSASVPSRSNSTASTGSARGAPAAARCEVHRLIRHDETPSCS